MTADEIIANGLHLAHFNPNHDPRNGRFAKSKLGQAIARHKQNRTPSDDYKKYKELSKRNPKSLTNDELEYMVKRKELEKKARGKTPAQEAAEAEFAKFAVKTIASAAVIAAAAVGANYLRKKYNINMESVAKKLVSGTTKFTGTIAKETASAVANAVKESLPTIKGTAKEASKAVGKTAIDSIAKVGEAEVKAATAAGKAVAKAATDATLKVGESVVKGATAGGKAAAKAATDATLKVGESTVKAATTAGKAVSNAFTKLGEAEVQAGRAILKRMGLG